MATDSNHVFKVGDLMESWSAAFGRIIYVDYNSIEVKFSYLPYDKQNRRYTFSDAYKYLTYIPE
jgi:hypothetical protein